MTDRDKQRFTSEHPSRRTRLRRSRAFASSSVLCTVVACSLDYAVGPRDIDDNNGRPGDSIDGGDSGIAREAGLLEDARIDGATGGEAALALVQRETTAQTGVAIPIVIAPTTAGDLLVMIVAVETNGIVVASIADNAPGGSNAYVSANQRSVDTSCGDGLEIWYAANVRPGATSVAVTITARADVEIWAAEFAGLSKTDPFDTGNIRNNQPQGPTITAPPVTPRTLPALVISAAMTCESITGLKADSPFQPLPILNGESAAYLFVQSAGSFGAVWNNRSATWNASTVVFK